MRHRLISGLPARLAHASEPVRLEALQFIGQFFKF
jgi:hypothetical protein